MGGEPQAGYVPVDIRPGIPIRSRVLRLENVPIKGPRDQVRAGITLRQEPLTKHASTPTQERRDATECHTTTKVTAKQGVDDER